MTQHSKKHEPQYTQFYRTEQTVIPSFGLWIKEALEEINKDLDNVTPITINKVALWTISKPHIDLTHKKKKKSMNKSIYGELRDKYCDYRPFYTVGSKILDRKDAAATNRQIHKQTRLPNSASIFTAELQAIKMALKMVENSEDQESEKIINFLV